MILKKPYAFIIKHFRIIHFIMALLMIYLGYKSYIIANFFSQTIRNNYNPIFRGQTPGMMVNYFMYIVIVIVLVILIAIYFLLRHKQKPHRFYTIAIIFYIILFIMNSVFYNYMTALMTGSGNTSILRTYRDLSLIMIVIQFMIALYCLMRSIGFNIKKFNFDAELKELELSKQDEEEFEFTVGIQGYKAKRNIRKSLREFRYYLKENSFIIGVLGGLLGAIIFLTLTFFHYQTNQLFKISQTIAHHSFRFSVEDSIISDLTYDGAPIKSNKYYVAIKLKVENIGLKNEVLDTSNFRLKYGKHTKAPCLDKSLYFKDFATPYYGGKIRKNSGQTIALVYEINPKDIHANFKLQIYRGSTIKPGEIVSKYNEIKLKPVLVNQATDANQVKLNETLEFIDSNIGTAKFKVTNFMFSKSYQYTYEVCQAGVCQQINDIVGIDYTSAGPNRLLLILDYEFKLDSKSTYFQNNPALKTFVNNFLKIRYQIGDTYYYSEAFFRTPSNLNDKLVLQVNSSLAEAQKVDLFFTIRNKNYIIELK